MADPAQIHQILMNLCTNAIHAMRNHEGILTIRLCRVELDIQYCSKVLGLKPGEYLKLEVADTGHGISEAILERIFDPYFTTKAPGEGTGLGLAVVKGIVDSHEGAIIATSEEEKGSLFVVYLPRYFEVTPPAQGAGEENIKGTERVLLVDDEPQLTSVGKAMLEHLGYTVTTCNQSPEALKLFRSQPDIYDVVITDQTMPVLTGVHLAAEILAIRPEMPIVLCTGYSDQIDKTTAEKMGIAEFITKPLSMKIIGKLVQNAVKKKRQ
jgi:CheY-like chemotaxis protein